MEKVTKIFAALLNSRKERLRMSAREIAQRTGVSTRTVQNWTMGVSEPQTAQDLRNLCAALEVPLSYFVDEPKSFSHDEKNLQTHSPQMGLHEEAPHHKETLREEIVRHLHRFLDRCGDDPKRLSWVLVEMQDKFPLNKFESPAYEKRGRATVKRDPAVDAAAKELLDDEK